LACSQHRLPTQAALEEVQKKSQGTSVRAYILTIMDLSTCVSVINGVFYVFDSHPHNKRGLPDPDEGKATITACLPRG
jgi:hypothetical protein